MVVEAEGLLGAFGLELAEDDGVAVLDWNNLDDDSSLSHHFRQEVDAFVYAFVLRGNAWLPTNFPQVFDEVVSVRVDVTEQFLC